MQIYSNTVLKPTITVPRRTSPMLSTVGGQPLQSRFPKEPYHRRAADDSLAAKKPLASNVIRLEIERVTGGRGQGPCPPPQRRRSAPHGFMQSRSWLGSSAAPAVYERVCCLLALKSVTSTPQWIRQPWAAWLYQQCGDNPGV